MADVAMGSNVEDRPKKTAKRKRPCLVLSSEEKESQIKGLNEEMVGLFGFYKEMITSQRLSLDLSACSGSLNGLVAALMEESALPLSRLVEEIHVKLREKEEMSLTPAAVKSAVLYVGQRVMYGVPNVDADVLEDDTETSLWCWETRDVKLLPKSVRGALKIRRMCRKKIHERITAVFAKLNALQKSESDPNFSHDLTKASERLSKVFSEAEIRVLVDSMLKKNDAELVEKDAKREEKLIIKQLEKNKREVEKEKKKMDREHRKEKQHSEKELKRLREEAEKDERRREKEDCEMRKQLRKQQEEAEKDQRRREKEAAEFKKQLAIKKQASIMERFLKRSKTSLPCQNDLSTSVTATTSDSLSEKCEKVAEAVTMSMDCALSSNDQININDLRRSHLSSWRHFGLSIRSNQNQHWGMRRKPKTALFKELKLTTNRCLPQDDDLTMEKLVDRWGEQVVDDRSCITSADNSSDVKKCNRRQLLQFDKSYRPAFYGIWPKKSHVVGPRHPLRKDPDLDYDVDSDEEWEEEDPGESLSDCDKDDEEEGCSKGDDEEETEDGFFVPDGYLSEDEGVQVDRMEVDLSSEETKSSPSCKQELQSEESCALLQQQKYLHNVTEHALRKNQPMIILNLMHEKTPLLLAEDLSGTSKMEQTCLQALTMRAFPAGLLIEITVDSLEDEEQEACLSNSKSSTTPVSTVKSIPESDLLTIVSVIQSCSTGINKVVESLQQKFPATPKSQLRNKVREISDFTDNRWQVKKEILAKLGLSISPEKNGGRAKSIAKFFSKRCLPPDGRSVNPNETSPPSSRKPGSAMQEEQVCTYNHL